MVIGRSGMKFEGSMALAAVPGQGGPAPRFFRCAAQPRLLYNSAGRGGFFVVSVWKWYPGPFSESPLHASAEPAHKRWKEGR